MVTALALSVLLGQGFVPPPMTARVAFDAGALVGVRDVGDLAAGWNDGTLLVAWTDPRRTAGSTGELPVAPQVDLWVARAEPATGGLRGLDSPNRLLCQAAPDEVLSAPTVAPVAGGFLVGWRSLRGGGRLRALRVAFVPLSGAVNPGCGAPVLGVSDGGLVGPPVLAVSGEKARVAWSDGAQGWSLKVSPATGEALSGPEAVLPGPAPRSLEVAFVGHGDGGFTFGWLERAVDGGSAAKVSSVGGTQHAGLEVASGATALSLVLAGAEPVALASLGPAASTLVALPLSTGSPQDFTFGAGGPPLLAAALGSSVTVLSEGASSYEWLMFSLSGGSQPAIGLWPPDSEPRALVGAAGSGFLPVAVRKADGAPLAYPSLLVGAGGGTELGVQPAPQVAPSLAFSSEAGFVVGWAEPGATGSGRLAWLAGDGAAQGPGPFVGAPGVFGRHAGNAAGTRLGALAGTSQGPQAFALTTAGTFGAPLLPVLAEGDRLALGDEVALHWRRTGQTFLARWGASLDASVEVAEAVRAPPRCAAQADGALWLPFFDANRELTLWRFDEARPTEPPAVVATGRFAPAAMTDLTPARPCAAAQGHRVAVTWREAGVVKVLEVDAVSSVVTSERSVAVGGLDVFPVLAPYAGGWVVAFEALGATPPGVAAVLLSPSGEFTPRFGVSAALRDEVEEEARGPQLQASPEGSVAAAWTAFDVAQGAVAVRARVLLAADAGWAWPDAGSRDAGDAADAGSALDGGADAGPAPADGGSGQEPVVFSSCGCRAVDPAVLLPGLLAAWAGRARRRRGAGGAAPPLAPRSPSTLSPGSLG